MDDQQLSISMHFRNLLSTAQELPPEYSVILIKQIDETAKAVIAFISTMAQRDITMAQAFEQHKLDLQYVLFDLEATKRERNQLRDQLEQSGDL